MPFREFTDQELLRYLDETLPVEAMAALEVELRGSEPLRRRLSALALRRDQGLHSVGEVWRRRRLTCPGRSELGSFLLGALEAARKQYVEFHLRTIGCRLCLANLEDLQSALDSADTHRRRRRFFQSSAGRLPGG